MDKRPIDATFTFFTSGASEDQAAHQNYYQCSTSQISIFVYCLSKTHNSVTYCG